MNTLDSRAPVVSPSPRLTYESLAALEIPNDMLQNIQDLVLDLRVRCVKITLQHTAEGAWEPKVHGGLRAAGAWGPRVPGVWGAAGAQQLVQ